MRIGFDFDGTLFDDFDGTINKQKEEIQNLCRKYIRNEHEVFICTKRWGPKFRNEGRKSECDIVYYIGKQLGIPLSNIIFTDRNWKTDKIKELNIDLFFENSEMEVKMIEKLGIKVIPIEDPYWRDLVY